MVLKIGIRSLIILSVHSLNSDSTNTPFTGVQHGAGIGLVKYMGAESMIK